jgi:hypothetical protein
VTMWHSAIWLPISTLTMTPLPTSVVSICRRWQVCSCQRQSRRARPLFSLAAAGRNRLFGIDQSHHRNRGCRANCDSAAKRYDRDLASHQETMLHDERFDSHATDTQQCDHQPSISSQVLKDVAQSADGRLDGRAVPSRTTVYASRGGPG